MKEQKNVPLASELITDLQKEAGTIFNGLDDIDANMEVVKFLFAELVDIGSNDPQTVDEACAFAAQQQRITMLANIGVDYADKICRLLTELIDRAHRFSRGNIYPDEKEGGEND